MEEKVMYGVLTVYRERGYYLRRLEQFEKSRLSYDEALIYYPENVRLLIGRSQVCADTVKPKEAFENAQAALKIEPSNFNARNVQARALYTMSDFERALVMNYRGVVGRKQPPYFREGISQGLETLEDCLGKNAGPVMLDFLPLIQANTVAMVDENEPEVKKHVSRIPKLEHKIKLSQMQIRKHETLSRVLAMKYLGPMANDKFFLEKLSADRRLQGANSKGSILLKSLVDESLSSLSERQEILRAQRPYYCVKWAEQTESVRLNSFKKDLLLKQRQINTRIADRLIKSIEKTMRERNMLSLMAQAERFQKFLDSKSPHSLPDKSIYLDRLYRAMGEGYLALHRLSYTLGEQGNRRRIAFLMGLPVGRPRSFDSVLATYPNKFIDIKHAIEQATHALEICENDYMSCWLMYEIAGMLSKQKNYALAKFYAKRCQRKSQSLSCATWWLNACFILMSGDVQQGNPNDVRIAVEEAYQWSRKHLQDPEQVQAFLSKCLELANEPLSADENKIVRKREREIISIMEEPTKVNTTVLFKRISNVPPGRRFRVLPSKPTTMDMTAERRKYRQPGLTVIPGMEQGLRRIPRSEIAGFQTFDLTKTKKGGQFNS